MCIISSLVLYILIDYSAKMGDYNASRAEKQHLDQERITALREKRENSQAITLNHLYMGLTALIGGPLGYYFGTKSFDNFQSQNYYTGTLFLVFDLFVATGAFVSLNLLRQQSKDLSKRQEDLEQRLKR